MTPVVSEVPDKSRVRHGDIVRSLLLDIFSGAMQSGDRLVETTLATRFGVSRTPIREALSHIASIGLVQLRHNCGAVMRPFGLRQVREIYEIRELLESDACRRACGRIAPVMLKDLIETFQSLERQRRQDDAWSKAEWTADTRLHTLIVDHCANQRLAETIKMYGELVQIVRETVGNQRRMQEIAIREHVAILRALLNNKPAAAAAAMRAHIHSACGMALEILKSRHT